jgi:hypothetical protein
MLYGASGPNGPNGGPMTGEGLPRHSTNLAVQITVSTAAKYVSQPVMALLGAARMT